MITIPGRYMAFKSIYVEQPKQFFLCDIYRSWQEPTYEVMVELVHEWQQIISYSKATGIWRYSKASVLPAELIKELESHIKALEKVYAREQRAHVVARLT